MQADFSQAVSPSTQRLAVPVRPLFAVRESCASDAHGAWSSVSPGVRASLGRAALHTRCPLCASQAWAHDL